MENINSRLNYQSGGIGYTDSFPANRIEPMVQLHENILNLDYSQPPYEPQHQSMYHRQGHISLNPHQLMAYNHAYGNIREIQQQQLNLTRQQELEAKQKAQQGFFFESPSKYISLKQHKSQNDTIAKTNTNQHQPPSSLGYKPQQVFESPSHVRSDIKLKDWFEQLSLHDKSIVLTIVDKQLVKLIFEMYDCYKEYRNGKFTNNYPTTPDQCSNNYLKLKNFNLLFELPRCDSNNYSSSYMKEIIEAEENLIQAVRLVNINQRDLKKQERKELQNMSRSSTREGASFKALHERKHRNAFQYFDGITLDLQFFSNCQYFFKMMHLINQRNCQFLSHQLKFSNDKEKLQNSVFYKVFQREDPTAYADEHQDPNIQEMPKKFFTFVPNDRLHIDKSSGMTLGQCLYMIFEKAINVQYNEYVKGFHQQHQQIQSYFFTEPQFDIFTYDQRLTHFWLELSLDERNKIIAKMNDIEKDMMSNEHLMNYKCPGIREDSNEENEDFSSGDEYNDRIYGKKKSKFLIESDEDTDLEKQAFTGNSRSDEEMGITFADHSTVLPYTTRVTGENQHSNQIIPSKNALLNQNKFTFQKINILSMCKNSHTELLAFTFIKSLSTHMSLDCLHKRDETIEMRERFYEIMIEQHEKKSFEDLMLLDDKEKSTANSNHSISIKINAKNAGLQKQQHDENGSRSKASKKNKKKKNKKNKDKQAAASTATQQQDDHSATENYKLQIQEESQRIDLVKQLVRDDLRSSQIDDDIFAWTKMREIEQRKIDERRSLLTEEYLVDKYPDDNFYQPPQPSVNEAAASQSDQKQTSTQQQKKKKRKNKKKSNKNKKSEEADANNNGSSTLYQEEQHQRLVSLFNDEPLDPQVSQPSIPIMKSENGQVVSNVLEDEIESINLDQIEIEVSGKGEETNENNEQDSKKINNYLVEKEVEDTEKVKNIRSEHDDDYQKGQNEYSKLTENLSANICNKVILAVEDKSQQQPNSESKKKKQQNQRKNKKPHQKPHNADTQSKSQLKCYTSDSETPSLSLIDQRYYDASENQKKQKQVVFREIREQSESDDIKIPKRGSSRGSSVGTEDVIHMHTLCSLGQLFPAEYKNPSSDTRTKINEITTQQPEENEQEQERKDTTYPAQKQEENLNTQNRTGKVYRKKEHHHQEFQKKGVEHRVIPEQTSKHHLTNLNSQKSKTKKSQKQASLLQSNFDSYETMFKKAYGESQTEQAILQIEEAKHSEDQHRVNSSCQLQQEPQRENTAQVQDINPVQHSQTKKNKKIRQEHRDIQEKGASVNPEILQSQLNSQATNNNANQHQKKVKNKILKNNYQPNKNQSLLHVPASEQRSQTPNIEQSSEPLHINSHNKGNNYQMQKKHNNNGKMAKNNVQKKKNVPHHQNKHDHQQTNFNQMHSKQNNQFNQQQQMYMQQQQPFILPIAHPQFMFNQQQQQQQQQQMAHNNIQPYMSPPLPPTNSLFSPQPFYQQPVFPPMPCQQFIQPKTQNSQQTQTDNGDDDNEQKVAKDKNNQDINQTQQQQNIQTMINQIQNFNIQVYQMQPFTQNYNPMNFNQNYMPQQMMDPQCNPQLMFQQQQQLLNQGMVNNPFFQNYMNQQAFYPNQFMYPQDSQQLAHQTNVSHQSLEEVTAQSREDIFYSRLDREIYKLQVKQQFKLSETETERQAAFKYIEQYVKETYQEYVDIKVQMYGSMATGLAIDSSDMDILVSGVFSDVQVIDRPLLIEQMRRLHKQMNTLFCLESNSLIETATVPVIKIIIDLQKIRDSCRESEEKHAIESSIQHLKVDITYNENEQLQYGGSAQPLHMGLKCCYFIKQKLFEYPQLKPLAFLLKKFLALRDLNAPFLGGLSSYGLILLIIAFINQDMPLNYDPNTDTLSPARIFVQFLLFYGKIFDPKISMINEYQLIVPQYMPSFSSVLNIMDPLNPINNIGKSTYNFDQIQNEFARAYDDISLQFNEFVTSAATENNENKKLHILNKILQEENLNEQEETKCNDTQDQTENAY